MSRLSETLLEGTGTEVEVTGEPLRVTGNRRFTVAIHTLNLTGTVHIEATLETEPSEADWFPVFSPIAYPRPAVKTKADVVGQTFKGNYTYLRARLTRPGLSKNANESGTYGIVDRVLLNR